MDYIVNDKMTGGFAALVYPAEYRNSGIMTFIIGKDGVVYQKDLGEGSTAVSAQRWRNTTLRRVDSGILVSARDAERTETWTIGDFVAENFLSLIIFFFLWWRDDSKCLARWRLRRAGKRRCQMTAASASERLSGGRMLIKKASGWFIATALVFMLLEYW